MRKHFRLLIIFFLFVNISFAQESSPVYKKTIASIGLITDKTGAVASGFFINSKTFITNHHVTDELDVKSAKIEMKNNHEYKVKRIVSEYKLTDLAIVEIVDECEDILELEDDERITKDEIVYSIGNPTDDDMHVDYFHITKGRVKKVGDDTWFYDNDEDYTHESMIIQHTAMIRPGNSGGPLLNEDGKVVGVNAFFYSDSSNYAIHVNELIKILDKNNISYNKSTFTEKKFNRKEKKTRNIGQRFEYVFERQAEIIKEYSVVFVLLTTLYYCFVFIGVIIITFYLIVSRPKPKLKRIHY